MNRTRLLLIGVIALVLGAFVSFAIYRNLKAGTASSAPPGVGVVVAANDLQVGAKIEEKDIKLVHIPEGDRPPNSFTEPSRVIGRGVVLPIPRGDFILISKLADANGGSGLPSLIPPGMRAVSVRVNEVVGVAGFVQPGTRVDVLLTGNPSGQGEQQTTTVLKNVLVLAAGQRLERTPMSDAQMAPVITLLVSPDDAQRLTLASTNGRIQLALRNPLDTRQDELGASNSGSLYKNASTLAQVAPKPTIKHVVVPAAPPAPYTIEVIKGTKKDVTKFPQ